MNSVPPAPPEKQAPSAPKAYATIFQRIGAHLVDILILAVPGIFLYIILGQSEEAQLTVSIILAILSIIYFTYMESTSGQTLGKQILHIKVISLDGQPCTQGAALKRNLARIVDNIIQPYIVGIISILVSEKKQRVGDMWAKTIVVKTS